MNGYHKLKKGHVKNWIKLNAEVVDIKDVIGIILIIKSLLAQAEHTYLIQEHVRSRAYLMYL